MHKKYSFKLGSSRRESFLLFMARLLIYKYNDRYISIPVLSGISNRQNPGNGKFQSASYEPQGPPGISRRALYAYSTVSALRMVLEG